MNRLVSTIDITPHGKLNMLDRGAEFGRIQNGLIRRAILLNLVVVIVLLLSRVSEYAAIVLGIGIVSYIIILALFQHKYALYVLFGMKLTYDALWNVGDSVWGKGPIHFLSLILIPLFIIVLLSHKKIRNISSVPLWSALLLILWSFFATYLNGLPVSLDFTIRQSGLFLGLLLGIAYIRDESDFNLIVIMMFISTIVPSVASLLQYVLSTFGYMILYFTQDSIRGMRYAGLYYDSGTTGMVMLIGLFSGVYIVRERVFSGWKRTAVYIHVTTAYFILLVGATRSMLVIATMALTLFLVSNMKKMFIILPVIIIILMLAKPQMDLLLDRTLQEGITKVKWSQVLTDRQYSGLFTGRLSIWQSIWYRYERASFMQKAFGSGQRTNSHSSYFFLLLQIGLFGMLLYIYLNLRILLELVYKRRKNKRFFWIGLFFVLGISLLGLSLNTIMYTTFQWATYMTLAGILNIINTRKERMSAFGALASS